MESEPLKWWLDWINVLIGAMWDANLRGVVELDYSRESLPALESFVRERYRGRYPLGDDPFNAGVVAYLGETLMRLAGGAWEWTTEEFPDAGSGDPDLRRNLAKHEWHASGGDEPDVVGLPIIRPDVATGLPALSPTHLLLDAVESTDGGVWASTCQRWQDSVNAYAADHPGWTPTKQHTLADGVFSSPAVSTVLDDWLAQQQKDFPQWAARYDGDWDYSPRASTGSPHWSRGYPDRPSPERPGQRRIRRGSRLLPGRNVAAWNTVPLGLPRLPGPGRP